MLTEQVVLAQQLKQPECAKVSFQAVGVEMVVRVGVEMVMGWRWW